MIATTLAATGCGQWLLDPRSEAPPRPEDVLAAARAGDAKAAFLAYKQATTEVERRKWVCIAANRDLAEAQAEIARLHWPGPGEPASPFGRDGYVAYIWSIIAIHRREPLERMERRLGWLIANGERWRATILAVSWRPDPSQCENMEESAYFSVPVDRGDATF